MFPRNAWYVAAWAHEVGREPLARKILGEDVVLFRQADGTPVALEDQCCHRQLPLSLGKVDGDGLRCGYHGYRFDASGACVEIPGQEAIPANAGVRAFTVVERWKWVWIWPGDAALADPAKIPDLWWCDHPDWQVTMPAMVPLACDARLIIDNVLDATHLTYVHASSIGSGGLTQVQPVIDSGENHVRVSRWVLDRPPPPMYAKAGNFEGNADRWAAVEFRAPGAAINFAGCVDVGHGGPQGDLSASKRRVELVAISLPTPSTDVSCYYFFAFSRAFAHDDPEVERMFSDVMVDVFREDFVILEAQQRRMNERPAARKVSTINDRASFLARGMIERMAAAER
jgi:phenylpropionate dioxygenase-like ring-hydroxylating dioxygenase large terminal subunit